MVTIRLVLERLAPLVLVWLVLVLAAMTCAGCGLSDALDGAADNPEDCCWLWPDTGAVASCVRASVPDLSYYEHDENGCIDVVCHPTLGGFHVNVCPADEDDPEAESPR